MGITKISLSYFRNHKQKEVDFSNRLTVIWGENGSGKTSVLEAIHILSLGKSFRTNRQKNLIMDGRDSFVISGDFLKEKSKDKISTQYKNTGKQFIKINGKAISGRKDLIGRNNVVVLSPEEQSITKGAPETRRRFFDKVFSVVSLDYFKTVQKYNRLLRQRNAVLNKIKDGRGAAQEVYGWDEQIATEGVRLWSLKSSFIKTYSELLGTIIKKYDESLIIRIITKKQKKDRDVYLEQLKETQLYDIKTGRTTFGPHRDNISFLLNKKNLRTYGSQGEHKICLVLLKLAEMCLVKEKTGFFPTLLLDDLFSKLDLARSEKLVGLLSSLETETRDPLQTIITTTDMIDVEKSGILYKNKQTKTHHLERKCST